MIFKNLFLTKEFIHRETLTEVQKELISKFNTNTDIDYETIPCEVCNSNNLNVLFTNDRLGINRNTVYCKECSFILTNPRMKELSAKLFYNSDLYRRIYHKNYDDKNILYYETLKALKKHQVLNPKKPNFKKYYKNLYFDFINNEITDYTSVLDVGCGMGLKLLDFSNIGKKAEGIDPSETFLKAHKEFNLNTSVGFINDVKKKYDLVILTHVFEHLYDLRKVTDQLSNITNKYLFLEIPGHYTQMQTIQNPHNYYFSANTLNFFILNNKFKLIKIEYDKEKEFIFALYKKTEKKNEFKYDKKLEKKILKRIIFNYYFKYYIIKIISFFRLKKYVKLIYNKLKR
jgi:SAM-dependent methyltransferase